MPAQHLARHLQLSPGQLPCPNVQSHSPPFKEGSLLTEPSIQLLNQPYAWTGWVVTALLGALVGAIVAFVSPRIRTDQRAIAIGLVVLCTGIVIGGTLAVLRSSLEGAESLLLLFGILLICSSKWRKQMEIAS